MNFSEYVAVLSGNTDLLEKAKLDKRVASLEAERGLFLKDAAGGRDRLTRLQSDADKLQALGERLARDEKQFQQRLTHDEKGRPHNPVILHGFAPVSTEELGRHLIRLNRETDTRGQRTEIGTLLGFTLHIQTESYLTMEGERRAQNVFSVGSPTGITYTHNHGTMSAERPETAARHFLQALKKIPQLRLRNDERLGKVRQGMDLLRGFVNQPWAKEDTLNALKTELRRVEERIVGTLHSPEFIIRTNGPTNSHADTNAVVQTPVLANSSKRIPTSKH